MRLVIHCGCHKTGTTAFQTLCSQNRALLNEVGVHYPGEDSLKQHSHLIWRIQAEGVSFLGRRLRAYRVSAGQNCDTVLLSGEDFENVIVDITLALEIEEQAHNAGFDDIVWIVVSRPSFDYAASIYAEMSKHKIVLQQSVIDKALLQRGCLYVSSHQFNYIFVLDFARFKDRFSLAICGDLWHFEMEEFLEHTPGGVVLKRLLGEPQYAKFNASMKGGNVIEHNRLSPHKVTQNYFATALAAHGKRDP